MTQEIGRGAPPLRALRARDRSRSPLRHDKTILLIEDDTEMRRLVARALERAGYRVVSARNGSEAVDWLGLSAFDGSLENVPSLIVSDLRLPDLSGLELLEAMIDAAEDVPMILITGFPSAETYAAAFELGAVRVLEKPFDLDDLCQAVHTVVEQHRAPSGGAAGSSPTGQ